MTDYQPTLQELICDARVREVCLACKWHDADDEVCGECQDDGEGIGTNYEEDSNV